MRKLLLNYLKMRRFAKRTLRQLKPKWKFFIIGIIIVFMFVIFFAALNYYLMQKDEANALIFYHWWTSAGEEAALNSLISVFSEKYPEVTVVPTSIEGGAGYTMLEVIKPLVLSKEAPDAFQMHATYEAKPYFDADLLDNVNDIWLSEELEKVIPKVVQVMCRFRGDYYSVPVDVHRVNVVWYNKDVLDKNNIDPSTLTTWDDFFDACDKLRVGGMEYPIQMGESWTAAHVFESIIASKGMAFYEDWVNGNVVSPDDPRLLEALGIFKKYLNYVNPDNVDLSWDKATGRVIDGESAFNIMGDWANGEFKAAGMTYEKDYGAFTVPGTERMYGLCIDTFQRPKYIMHPENSKRWLKVISSKEGQDAFNPIKGSISARIDTNKTKYDLYQQSAIFDFLTLKYMFPSIVHGSGAPESFKVKLKEIISDFIVDLDIIKAANELTNYTKEISDEYTIEWELD